jgi:predicted alpha/beta superfamily hydrolase
VTAPSTTPPGAQVFVTGSFQGWAPGDPAFELTSLGARRYELALRFEVGTALEFKFTRGAWTNVEKGSSGEELPNRQHTVTAPATLALTVGSWADLSPLPHTIVGDVSQITVPGFLDGRRVWVYLPPQYDEQPAVRYPVLYMFDGQNVFDRATSFSGEWEVDETCESLIAAAEISPLIVVAVDNGGSARIPEYTPWPGPGYTSGGGDAHLAAFVDTLVPYVDATFRTLTGPAHRGLAGSSLGGLMSLYAAYARPGTFGRIAALSPSLWWDGDHLLAYVSASTKPAARLYTDMGTRESGRLVDDNGNGVDDSIDRLRALRAELIDQGFVEGLDLLVVEDDGATHSESYWAERFPDALRFLFPPTAR